MDLVDPKHKKDVKNAKKKTKSEKLKKNGIRESGVYMQMQSQDSDSGLEYQNFPCDPAVTN